MAMSFDASPKETTTPKSWSIGHDIGVTVVRDCTYRLEAKYRLPGQVTNDVLAGLAPVARDGVTLTPFSRYVAGGKDLFRFHLSDWSIVRGLVGDTILVATYGKVGERLVLASETASAPILKDQALLEECLRQIFGDE